MTRRTDVDAGRVNREFKAVWKAIRESNAAKRLQAATIGKGGITVKDGGGVSIRQGGTLNATYPDEVGGGEAVRMGPLRTSESTAPGYGVQVLSEDGGLVWYAVRNYPTTDFPDGLSAVGGTSDYLSPRVKLAATITRVDLGGGIAYVSLDPGGAYLAAPEGVHLDGGANGVMLQHGTTSSAANTYIDGDGRIWRTTSSGRYKQDTADAAVDVEAALQLIPRRFRRKDEVAELGDAAPWYVGFIAEEAAELGLDDWVTCDDTGPEAFAYSTWGVALQAIARKQQQQIDALSARLDALEAGDAAGN